MAGWRKTREGWGVESKTKEGKKNGWTEKGKEDKYKRRVKRCWHSGGRSEIEGIKMKPWRQTGGKRRAGNEVDLEVKVKSGLDVKERQRHV